MTIADYLHPTPGPIKLSIHAGSASILILAAQTSNAVATVSTPAASGPFYDAVSRSTVVADGDRLTITVPPVEAPASRRADTVVGVQINSGSGVFVGGDNKGVIYSGGAAEVGGEAAGAEQIRITVELPDGSDLDVELTTGSVAAQPRLGDVRVEVASGNLSVHAARSLAAEIVSGQISADSVEAADLRMTSGQISLESVGTLAACVALGQITVSRLSGAGEMRVGVGSITAEYSGPEPSAHSAVGSCMLRAVATG